MGRTVRNKQMWAGMGDKQAEASRNRQLLAEVGCRWKNWQKEAERGSVGCQLAKVVGGGQKNTKKMH